MKALLAAGIVAGITLGAAGYARTIAQDSGPARQVAAEPAAPALAPAHYDLDRDGAISILDLTRMAQFFGRGAEPCVRLIEIVHYETPITSVGIDGSPILIEGRSVLDPDDPLTDAVLAGTPIARCQ